MKNTKIVATVGPASESKEVLRKMVEAGMNVVRLNFSHNEHSWHGRIIELARELSEELRQPIGVLADLQGPRIRTTVDGEIALSKGDHIWVGDMGTKTEPGGKPNFRLDAKDMVAGMKPGDAILIEDGLIELRVVLVVDGWAEAEAVTDVTIKNRKGVILPDSKLTLPILSAKDKKDLAFALNAGVDFVALSFVGSAKDIEDARAEMKKILGVDAQLPQIVAKIERKEAIKNLKEILRVTDAVMVARGDLGIEMPESEVAILQKTIVAESLSALRPVIVATQMMKSMVESPRPTRAEVSDVSNAVIDHCDAVMLSEESAMGKYPVETIAMMSEILEKTEESPFDDLYQSLDLNMRNEYAVMIRSVYELAKSFGATAVMLLSMGGRTARLISHFRPEMRLLVATNSRKTWQQLSLVWGIDAYLFEGDSHLDTFIDKLEESAKTDGKLVSGDSAVVFHGRTPDRETLRMVGIREIK